MLNSEKNILFPMDERRDLIVPGDAEKTLQFCIELFISLANQAIANHNYFAAALSGGSTPKAIYQGLSSPKYASSVDWKKVFLFWSDERCVPHNHPESNYHMAMEAGISKLPIPSANIFPMPSEGNLEKGAEEYEKILLTKVPSGSLDLVMLGMGEDGHTASLFPKTHALHTQAKLVVPNYIPQKSIWRMTFTFECINKAHHTNIYVLGKSKAEMVKKIFTSSYEPDELPIQRVGTPAHKALWILDTPAAGLLKV